MNTDFESAKGTERSFIIPGGFFQEEGEEKYLYNVVHLREMDGEEEDILANEGLSFVERMHRATSRCIIRLGSTINGTAGREITEPALLIKTLDNMLLSDANLLFLRLRQVSLGDMYRFKVRCPDTNCRKEQSKFFDLSKFAVEPMKGDPLMRTRHFTTRAGVQIVWQMLTGADERRLDSMEEYAGSHKKGEKEKATLALMARVKTINGEPATKETLKKVPMLDRAMLRKQFDDEGGVDMSIKIKCRSCGVEFERDLPIGGVDFFTPSEALED